jgi:YhcH/YjgK/YiaL family protein
VIISNLQFLSQYKSLIPKLEWVDLNLTAIIADFKAGMNNALPDNMKVIYFEGKALGFPKLEAHRKFIDLHLVLEGCDCFGYKTLSDCKESVSEFNEIDDYVLFQDSYQSNLILYPNEFAVFLPSDAHAPLMGEDFCKKLVIKIPFQDVE